MDKKVKTIKTRDKIIKYVKELDELLKIPFEGDMTVTIRDCCYKCSGSVKVFTHIDGSNKHAIFNCLDCNAKGNIFLPYKTKLNPWYWAVASIAYATYKHFQTRERITPSQMRTTLNLNFNTVRDMIKYIEQSRFIEFDGKYEDVSIFGFSSLQIPTSASENVMIGDPNCEFGEFPTLSEEEITLTSELLLLEDDTIFSLRSSAICMVVFAILLSVIGYTIHSSIVLGCGVALLVPFFFILNEARKLTKKFNEAYSLFKRKE